MGDYIERWEVKKKKCGGALLADYLTSSFRPVYQSQPGESRV